MELGGSRKWIFPGLFLGVTSPYMRDFLLGIKKEEKNGNRFLKQARQVQESRAKNPCIHVSTNLIVNPQILVKAKFSEKREFADGRKFGSLKKSQPAGLSFKSLDFSPILGIIYLGWTVTEADLSMEKEDFRDETSRRLLEKGTPG